MLTITVCVALSSAGLAVAVLTACQRSYLRAVRIAAWALLPVGLAASGLLDLAGRIGRAVGAWFSGLASGPTVWAGFGLLALAALLHLVACAVAVRRRATAPADATADAGPAGAVPPSRQEREVPPRTGQESAGGPGDLRDVEAILKKHGI